MSTILNKSFAPNQKTIKYLGRDFNQFKSNLIEFAKNYYSKTYTDFNDVSPGMMYIDQAAYVGDVLSFYIDYQFKEGLIDYAEERKNVVNLAKYLGYIPRPTKPSVGYLDVYQLVPALKMTGSFGPNLRYALRIEDGLETVSSNNVSFITTDVVDFSVNLPSSPLTSSVYSYDSTGEPNFYLLQKNVEIFSGKNVTTQFFIPSTFTPNLSLSFPDNNIIKINNVVDSENNQWHQVDYLAQSLIELPLENNQLNFETFYNYKSTVPSILTYLRTNRRFTIGVDENNITSMNFGPSDANVSEEIVIPNSEVLGAGFSNLNKYNLTLDSTNFVRSSAYGISPYNTTLTVNYVVGGGIESNAPSNSITTISGISITELQNYSTSEIDIVNLIKSSIRVNNSMPTTGGDEQETVYQIKQNALSNFSAQNRLVTKEDYISKVFNMPAEYGYIAKAYVTTESDLNTQNTSYIKGLLDQNNNMILDDSQKNFRKINMDGSNQFGVNLYLLTYDDNKNLTQINDAIAYNLKTYLSKYRCITDRINLIDGFIINIGVNFSILPYSNYNKKDVLSNCVSVVQNFFDINQWQFSQPINLSRLQLEITNVEGVQSLANLEVVNLNINDGEYSIYEYDILAATKNNIIYPPIDPAVFEIKYPNVDIRGSSL